MDCVQVFTKNQRQWAGGAVSDQQREAWLTELRRMNWDAAPNNAAAARVVSHNSYLVNLASPAKELWKKSVAAQRAELERCESLLIPLCVSHPGAHLGPPRSRREVNDLHRAPTRFEIAGLKRIIKALDLIHRDLAGFQAMTCLETTVGAGTNLGYSFGQLSCIRQGVRQPERIGFCFDTCHVTAAGYDMTSDQRALAVVQEFDAVCGIGNLRVFHFNDSVGAVGSRRDRHAHIGQGCCTRACFRTILNHPAFAGVPKILETPKGRDDKGVEWDIQNIRRLKRMTRRPFPADKDAAGLARVQQI